MIPDRPNLKHMLFFGIKATYVAGLAVLVVVLAVLLSTTTIDNLNRPRSLTVDGAASRYVAPDTSVLSLGAVVEDASAAVVQERASQIITDGVAAFKALGLEDSEIQTGGYSITPVYNDAGTAIVSYSIEITVNIRTLKLDKVSEILDAATVSGMNQVNSLGFEISNIEDIQDELTLEAIDDAKERAVVEAARAGLSLGKVQNVYDSYYLPYYDSRLSYAGAAEDSVSSSDVVKNMPVNPGETEISVSVSIEYQVL